MKKLAVLSDIHGNWPALEALLRALPGDCELACCGDFVGYYPYVNEVCDWARSVNLTAVRGNHEAMLLGELLYDPARDEAYRIKQAKRTLSPENAAWLAALPKQQELTFAGQRLIIRHASPWDETTYLYADSPQLQQLTIPTGEVLVVGHTHRPYVHQAGEGWVVNAGSVGQPRDYDPRACCALLDETSGRWEHLRVPYDHAALQQELRTLHYQQKCIDLLSRTSP